MSSRLQAAKDAHRKRHSTTGFEFAIADRIDYLPTKYWDAVTKGQSWFLSSEYLRILEQAMPEGLSGRYALLFADRRPVAAIAAQVLEINGAKILAETTVDTAGELSVPKSVREKLRGVVRKAASNVKGRAVSRLRGRILVCGNLLSWGQHAVAFADGYSREALWAGVAEALYRIRRAERLAGQTDLVMIKDLTDAESVGVAELDSFDYRTVETDPNMVLEVPPHWKSFDDYLNDLASKYRSGARKIIRDTEACGIRLEVVTDLKPYCRQIYRLYENVHHKAAIRPISLSPDYLPALAAHACDVFRCTIAKLGDEIVGFITSIRDGDTSVGYYIGFDYSVNERAPLYFRLLQICIDDAIAFGCRRISYGRTALDPKARMGAKPEPMHIRIRHRHPIINWLIRGLLESIPHDEAPIRTPFRP
ncbi:MAG: GNAT family N-acetyltransferase [Planctomyces sp.]|nr:GNAT family N-acetyltransferase [Planctomyces sp.]